MRRFVAQGALALVALPLGAGAVPLAFDTSAAVAAPACSTPELTLAQKSRLNFVFTGEVTDVAVSSKNGSQTKVYSVAVESWWSGNVGESVKVASPARVADCGLTGVREGERYVFFADNERAGRLQARSYEGTAPARPSLRRDLTALLGQPTPATATEPAPVELDPTSTVLDSSAPPKLADAITPAAIGVLAGALLLGLGTVLGRRER
ncbi:hypothetical protein ACLM5J_08360 [Nocardioides sp. Bht2]|uniref:hypothetical protein n=1 Tax=Nocardioides sp. Bht2 TaxID=3392297 RepID=UPI0039B6DF30